MSSEMEENDFWHVVSESGFDDAEERRRKEIDEAETEGEELEYSPKRPSIFSRIKDMVARRGDVNHEGVHWDYDEDPTENIRRKAEERWEKEEKVLEKKLSNSEYYKNKYSRDANNHLGKEIKRKESREESEDEDVGKENVAELDDSGGKKSPYGKRYFERK